MPQTMNNTARNESWNEMSAITPGHTRAISKRREGQTGKDFLLPIEQHGEFINADHDRRAHRRHHGAGKRGVKHHGDKRPEGRDL